MVLMPRCLRLFSTWSLTILTTRAANNLRSCSKVNSFLPGHLFSRTSKVFKYAPAGQQTTSGQGFRQIWTSMEWTIPPLPLYVVEGSFTTADDIDGGAVDMDAAVWSKLPEQLIWEVVRLVPAGNAAHFRWQSVSRNWRQVLTSANFRNTLGRASSRPSEEDPEERQPPVVAGVVMGATDDDSSARDDSGSELEVLEVDLTSIPPDWFWTRSSYTVETAADGLVCISNDSFEDLEKLRYCVLNPLTRTYRVLPHVPAVFQRTQDQRRQEERPHVWLHPSPTAATGSRTADRPHAQVSIFRYKPGKDGTEAGELHVGTYDLGGPGGGDGTAWQFQVAHLRSSREGDPVVAMCGGETYVSFADDSRVRVLAPAPAGGPGTALVEAAALDKPSVTLLGLDAETNGPWEGVQTAWLAEHRGELLYLDALCEIPGADAVLGVWRLARERLEWEAVAGLDLAEMKRLTGLRSMPRRKDCDVHLQLASGVGEVLYCTLDVCLTSFKLGLNLDTGEWEVVLDPDGCSRIHDSRLFELRPDVFLL